MNWVVLFVSLSCLARRSVAVVPAYSQYDLPQRQSVGGPGGYQGPPVVPVILPGGFIADTEEVARAKDLHFSAFAQAASKVKYSPVEYSQPKYSYSAASAVPQHLLQPQRQQDYNVPQPRYTAPASRAYTQAVKPIYQSQPQLEYSPQQLKYSPQQPEYSPQQKYQGPPVIPVVLPSGYIAETADVEAAKQHHFQLVAQAQAAVARAQERDSKKYGYSGVPTTYHQQEDDGSQYDDEDKYNQVYQVAPKAAAYRASPALIRQPYQGPPAVPVILPSGHIADTAEVAAAKISHLQQLLDAAQKALPQQRYHAAR